MSYSFPIRKYISVDWLILIGFMENLRFNCSTFFSSNCLIISKISSLQLQGIVNKLCYQSINLASFIGSRNPYGFINSPKIRSFLFSQESLNVYSYT